MKVALLLSGHFRDAVSCFSTINDFIIERFSPDVFISSWNPDDRSRNQSSIHNTELSDSLTFDQIISLYKPKITKSEDFDSQFIQKLIDKSWHLDFFGPKNGEINPISVYCMWYKINSALELMLEYEQKCGFKYDYIIKGRFDIEIYDDIDLESNTNYIKIPQGFDWRGGYNDVLAWGNRKPMIYYCSLFPHIEKYVLEDGVFYHPETLLKHHLFNSPYGVERPFVRIKLRDKNIWEIANDPNNGKKYEDI